MIHIDYQKHNEEVKLFLKQYDEEINPRIRMSIACNPRIILLNSDLNPDGITFEKYFNDPSVMLDIQMKFMEYVACNIVFDHVMGMEETEFTAYPDFQNILEPCWLGASVFYPDKSDSATRSFLTDDNKADIFKKGNINPFGGIMQKAMACYHYFIEQQKAGFTYKGKPLSNIGTPGLGTDGPFTNACSLRGATGMCIDLYEDPVYAHELMAYITENTILRIRALRKLFGLPNKTPNMAIADDSIAMLSSEDYIRFVLPFHKQILNELTTGEQPNIIHLCGDATRHFSTIAKELNADYFDTGFPVDHCEIVKELGNEVTVAGGVHVDLLHSGTVAEIVGETRRILEAVKPYSRRFIIKEANNLTPGTAPEHLLAMYQAVKKYGMETA